MGPASSLIKKDGVPDGYHPLYMAGGENQGGRASGSGALTKRGKHQGGKKTREKKKCFGGRKGFQV